MCEENNSVKIVFPVEHYPIKIIGKNVDDFVVEVHKVLLKHDLTFDSKKSTLHPSKQNHFISLRTSIYATGVEQLQNIFEDLKKLTFVQMVL